MSDRSDTFSLASRDGLPPSSRRAEPPPAGSALRLPVLPPCPLPPLPPPVRDPQLHVQREFLSPRVPPELRLPPDPVLRARSELRSRERLPRRLRGRQEGEPSPSRPGVRDLVLSVRAGG